MKALFPPVILLLVAMGIGYVIGLQHGQSNAEKALASRIAAVAQQHDEQLTRMRVMFLTQKKNQARADLESAERELAELAAPKPSAK